MKTIEMSDKTLAQIQAAYRLMATKALYRPAAPSDGCGNITVPEKYLDLEAEAAQYAENWWNAEEQMAHVTGTCNFSTRAATIFAVEASKNMCSGRGGNVHALRLLKMAVKSLENTIEAEGEWK
jgi:hypothetical protein